MFTKQNENTKKLVKIVGYKRKYVAEKSLHITEYLLCFKSCILMSDDCR
jgi:hypothetical protein